MADIMAKDSELNLPKASNDEPYQLSLPRFTSLGSWVIVLNSKQRYGPFLIRTGCSPLIWSTYTSVLVDEGFTYTGT